MPRSQGRNHWTGRMSSDEPGWERGSTETEKAGDRIWHPSPSLGVGNNLLCSPSFPPFSVFFSSNSFSHLHSSIPSKLKKRDSPSVMEGLWEGLIASFALFRCTNRPLLTIITHSSYVIQTSSIFHALNMSQARYLSLIVQ